MFKHTDYGFIFMVYTLSLYILMPLSFELYDDILENKKVNILHIIGILFFAPMYIVIGVFWVVGRIIKILSKLTIFRWEDKNV